MVQTGNLAFEYTYSTGAGNMILVPTISDEGNQFFRNHFDIFGTSQFYYCVRNQLLPEWEVGIGHMTDATTFVRDQILEGSNGTSAVNFSVGKKDVISDMPAALQNHVDKDGNAFFHEVQINGGTGAGVTLEVGGTIDADYYSTSTYGQIIDNTGNAHFNNVYSDNDVFFSGTNGVLSQNVYDDEVGIYNNGGVLIAGFFGGTSLYRYGYNGSTGLTIDSSGTGDISGSFSAASGRIRFSQNVLGTEVGVYSDATDTPMISYDPAIEATSVSGTFYAKNDGTNNVVSLGSMAANIRGMLDVTADHNVPTLVLQAHGESSNVMEWYDGSGMVLQGAINANGNLQTSGAQLESPQFSGDIDFYPASVTFNVPIVSGIRAGGTTSGDDGLFFDVTDGADRTILKCNDHEFLVGDFDGNSTFSGTISTDAQTNNWKLGGYSSGTAIQTGKIAVTINGTTFQLLTA